MSKNRRVPPTFGQYWASHAQALAHLEMATLDGTRRINAIVGNDMND